MTVAAPYRWWRTQRVLPKILPRRSPEPPAPANGIPGPFAARQNHKLRTQARFEVCEKFDTPIILALRSGKQIVSRVALTPGAAPSELAGAPQTKRPKGICSGILWNGRKEARGTREWGQICRTIHEFAKWYQVHSATGGLLGVGVSSSVVAWFAKLGLLMV